MAFASWRWWVAGQMLSRRGFTEKPPRRSTLVVFQIGRWFGVAFGVLLFGLGVSALSK